MKKVSDRHREIARFKTDPNIRVLLASNKLAKTGIDLGFVDVLIIVEPCDTVNEYTQIKGRVQRIGQSPAVLEQPAVVVFVISDSIEESIWNGNNSL